MSVRQVHTTWTHKCNSTIINVINYTFASSVTTCQNVSADMKPSPTNTRTHKCSQPKGRVQRSWRVLVQVETSLETTVALWKTHVNCPHNIWTPSNLNHELQTNVLGFYLNVATWENKGAHITVKWPHRYLSVTVLAQQAYLLFNFNLFPQCLRTAVQVNLLKTRCNSFYSLPYENWLYY